MLRDKPVPDVVYVPIEARTVPQAFISVEQIATVVEPVEPLA